MATYPARIPASRNRSTVRQSIRHHRTRRACQPFDVATVRQSIRQAVANIERGNRAQPFRPVSLSGKPWRPCAGFVGNLSATIERAAPDSGQCRRILPAVRSTVARSPCNRGNRSTLARLNRAENGLASRPPLRPCPRPSETRRAFCKPSAPRLQRNQRKPSRRKSGKRPATRRPCNRSTVPRRIRRQHRTRRTCRACQRFDRAPPVRAGFVATVGKDSPPPSNAATVRQSIRQAVAVRRAAGSVRRSTVCRLSVYPATRQGFRRPSATVRPWRNLSGATVRAIAATVRASPATFGRIRRQSIENGLASRPPIRPCPRPSETRRAFCKPSAPRLQRNQRQASGNPANIAASVRQSPPSNAAGFARQSIRPPPSNAPRRRIRRNIKRGKPSAVATYPAMIQASRNRSTVANIERRAGFVATVCQSIRQAVANIERGKDSGNAAPVATIERAAPIPANVAGYCPPSAPPLPVRLAIAATVRASPATFGRYRAENGLASRPPRRPCPRPSEMRRAFCKPSAPRLQHNQRKPSGDVATVQPFRPVSGSTVRPWRTSNAAPDSAATVRQSFRQHRTRRPIRRPCASRKPWRFDVCRVPLPANVAGYCPPSVQPLPVRLAIAATVRPSPA